MNAHVQPPAPRAGRNPVGGKRPLTVIPPRVLGTIQALIEAGGPVLIHDLAATLNVRLRLVPGIISLARQALAAHGGTIPSAGTGTALTYRIEVPDADVVDRIRGMTPVPAHMGFAGIRASCLKAITDAGPAPIGVGAVSHTVFGADNKFNRVRVVDAVAEVRGALPQRDGAGIIVVGSDHDGPIYTWTATASPDVVPAAAVAPPASVPERRPMPIGITLPPCGYTAWSFRPATSFRGPSHIVVHPGETCTRILTELDASSGLNTERAPIAPLSVEDDA